MSPADRAKAVEKPASGQAAGKIHERRCRPNPRPPRPASGLPNCPTGAPAVRIPLPCKTFEISRTLVFDAPQHAPGFHKGVSRRQPRHRPPRHRGTDLHRPPPRTPTPKTRLPAQDQDHHPRHRRHHQRPSTKTPAPNSLKHRRTPHIKTGNTSPNNPRRHQHHQQQPARLDDRTARRHHHHQPGQLRADPAAYQRFIVQGHRYLCAAFTRSSALLGSNRCTKNESLTR
jgi:hypothetical protein